MQQYHSYEEILAVLRQTPKGAARAEILNVEANRKLVLNSGANVTLFCGQPAAGKSMEEKLQNVYVGLLERQNAKSGKPEGFGGLGGLSERTNKDEFFALSLPQQEELIGLKDDVVLDEFNCPVLTDDIDIIRKNNVMRETYEEMGNLGIYDFVPDADKLEVVDMPGVKDDNYILNVWNGGGQVWAVTPFCHILHTDEELLNRLSEQSLLNRHEANSEARRFHKMPLFEALPRWGGNLGGEKSEDGRDMTYDYRYPHEWLVSWRIASDCLEHDAQQMKALAAEIQSSVRHRLDFENALRRMGQTADWADNVLKLPSGTVAQMQEAAGQIRNLQQNRDKTNAVSGI